nr:MAG TPA: hypothetical protein [Caudoviricetes sp.]
MIFRQDNYTLYFVLKEKIKRINCQYIIICYLTSILNVT